ncbi:hypothetical protein QBC47DRAFT_435861 [Echria macrotheca]|uniref:RING-type domain-containing protein n=1 Tax=Echria macrotheca TaxID=438768 RepID=A0AAJ0BMQ1_9PEZI|nr:hypothetical protein QBC47DRAFT_435861 [Echria macrotheca]
MSRSGSSSAWTEEENEAAATLLDLAIQESLLLAHAAASGSCSMCGSRFTVNATATRPAPLVTCGICAAELIVPGLQELSSSPSSSSEREAMRKLPCGHVLGAMCLARWIEIKLLEGIASPSCPYCRQPIDGSSPSLLRPRLLPMNGGRQHGMWRSLTLQSSTSPPPFSLPSPVGSYPPLPAATVRSSGPFRPVVWAESSLATVDVPLSPTLDPFDFETGPWSAGSSVDSSTEGGSSIYATYDFGGPDPHESREDSDRGVREW